MWHSFAHSLTTTGALYSVQSFILAALKCTEVQLCVTACISACGVHTCYNYIEHCTLVSYTQVAPSSVSSVMNSKTCNMFVLLENYWYNRYNFQFVLNYSHRHPWLLWCALPNSFKVEFVACGCYATLEPYNHQTWLLPVQLPRKIPIIVWFVNWSSLSLLK